MDKTFCTRFKNKDGIVCLDVYLEMKRAQASFDFLHIRCIALAWACLSVLDYEE